MKPFTETVTLIPLHEDGWRTETFPEYTFWERGGEPDWHEKERRISIGVGIPKIFCEAS
jgi:hypothetical protein